MTQLSGGSMRAASIALSLAALCDGHMRLSRRSKDETCEPVTLSALSSDKRQLKSSDLLGHEGWHTIVCRR